MAGFREFLTGEVLTAANVNSFLMKQSVMVFADAAARTAALGAEVAEGMLTYNEDTEQLEVFDGTNFVLAAPAPPAGIGSNVVQTVKTDTFTTSSATYVNITGMSVAITPSSATSKVLVVAQFNATLQGGDVPNQMGAFQITGGNAGDYIGDADGNRVRAAVSVASGASFFRALEPASLTVFLLDDPATASSVTYQLQGRSRGFLLTFNRSSGDGNNDQNTRLASSITAIEVAA